MTAERPRAEPAGFDGAFPDADVVVFGHSHVPVNEEGEDGQLLFNPGSPTQRRAQPVHSIGELQIAGGVVTEHRIIALDAARGRKSVARPLALGPESDRRELIDL